MVAVHNTKYFLLSILSHSVIEQQQQFGQKYNPDDIIIFNVTVDEPDNVAYLIDLYTYSSRRDPDEPPVHLGYHYVLPNVLRKSDGELELPITCASKHRPLGLMNIEYLKVCYNFFVLLLQKMIIIFLMHR